MSFGALSKDDYVVEVYKDTVSSNQISEQNTLAIGATNIFRREEEIFATYGEDYDFKLDTTS